MLSSDEAIITEGGGLMRLGQVIIWSPDEVEIARQWCRVRDLPENLASEAIPAFASGLLRGLFFGDGISEVVEMAESVALGNDYYPIVVHRLTPLTGTADGRLAIVDLDVWHANGGYDDDLLGLASFSVWPSNDKVTSAVSSTTAAVTRTTAIAIREHQLDLLERLALRLLDTAKDAQDRGVAHTMLGAVEMLRPRLGDFSPRDPVRDAWLNLLRVVGVELTDAVLGGRFRRIGSAALEARGCMVACSLLDGVSASGGLESVAMTIDKYEEYWKNPPAHTLTKLLIHRHYLGTWFAKLGQTMPRVVYIDGFAGRGAYGTGDVGSPLVALDVAANHIGRLDRCDIRMFFIEHRAENAAELQRRVDQQSQQGLIPKHITVEVVNGSFGSQMERIVSGVERLGAQMAPSFVMIDPFGWTDFGMDLIHRLSKLSGRSEILVTFMEGYVARAVPQDEPALEEELDRLYGGREHWVRVRDVPPGARRSYLLGQYDARLRAGGYRYVYAFEMRNARNITEYYLVFATKNIEGLAGMKAAMWKADPSGQFQFSDYVDNQRRTQPVLFAHEVDVADLKQRIVNQFSGQTVQVDRELRQYVLVDTPYLDTHYKRQILGPMEKAGELTVMSSPRKGKSGYPDGTIVRFS